MSTLKRKRVQLHCKDASRTIQSAKQECDINYILKKHAQTGILEHVRQSPGDYGDFISAPDFHTALNQLKKAEESFMLLPSDIRLKFNNSPADFLDFAQNSENLPEMVEMGLAKARPIDPKKEAEKTPSKTDAKTPEITTKSSEK